LEGDPVILRVGEDGSSKHITVHKNLICEASPFFQNALRNDWKEAKEGIVSLPDDSLDVVHCYVRWIYYKRVITPSFQAEKEDDNPAQHFLADCYAFGDKVQDLDFKDAVIDASLKRTLNMKMISGRMIKTIYAHTQENGPARKVYVDLLVWWDDDAFQDRKWLKDVSSMDFLLDCITALAKSRRDYEEERYDGNTCIYHEHTKTGSLCYKKKRSGHLQGKCENDI